jgi:hypothetical protein
MDTDFWVKACNVSFSRPVEELRQRNDTAYGVAVSCLALPGAWLPRPLLTPSSDFRFRHFRRCQHGILLVGLQAASMEAERERDSWRPHME